MGAARDVVEGFYERFGAADIDGTRVLYTDDCVTVTPTGSLTNDEHEAFGRAFTSAFPDAHMLVTHVFESGEEVCVLGRFQGTHEGDLVSPGGTIPATGRSLDMPFADYFQVRDGKIAAQESIFDQMTLLAQLGALGG
ncbi:MAG: ester cyclase [Acidimicrobiales bacterium]